MNICFLITRSDSIGGAQVHVRDLATSLKKSGHLVSVGVGGRGPFVSELEKAGIPCYSLSHLQRAVHPYQDLLAFLEIRSLLKKLRPDIVATHSSKAGWIGRLAGYTQGIPTVFTAHGWAFTVGVPKLSRILYLGAERAVGKLSSKIITVSEYDRFLALRYRVGKPDNVVTIHNGIPDITDEYRACRNNPPPKIIMVARFDKQKDQGSLIKALVDLRQCNWELDLVGDGPLRGIVERECNDLGLSHRVHFHGQHGDVGKLLAESNIFVLASNWEGLPLSVLEAMRAGLPVIATDVGGVREAVVDGQTGYLYPRGDITTLSKHIKRLILDEQLQMNMGNQGRMRYEKNFKLENMVKRTLSVYQVALTT